jgi:hypothetical protein
MRRVEIIQAVQNVAEALSKSKVMSALARMDTTELVCAHADWVARRQSFGTAEDHIVKVLELGKLDDPRFWATALSDGANADPEVLGPISLMHKSARFAQDELPKLIDALLAIESDPVLGGEGMEGARSGEATGLLKVLVIENDDFSTPQRLVLVLSAIDDLYRASAKIVGESDDQVSVVACDSGGDKTFDFLGSARTIECVRDVVLSFWDRMVFFRDDRTDERLRLIAESLPILEQVEFLVESGGMDPVTAERVKREVRESVFMFAQAGATIPEFHDFSVYDPREVMRPESRSTGSQESSAARAQKSSEPGKAEKASAEPEPEPEPEAASEAASDRADSAAKPPVSEERPLDSVELRRIVAEKVDRVLHSQGVAQSEAVLDEAELVVAEKSAE